MLTSFAPNVALEKQIAGFLLNLIPIGQPRRLAKMNTRATGAKYRDISARLTSLLLCDHASGRATYSYTIDQDGRALVGVIDIDQGGLSALTSALEAAQRRGITAFGIHNHKGDKHKGGHVWCLFDLAYPSEHISAQMRQIASDAGLGNVEIWPGCNQGIRALFGKHQIDGTRGDLLTQDGQIISLDDDLATGFDVVISLPLNTAPPVIEVLKPAQRQPQATSIRMVSPSGTAAKRASLDDVKARFNAENTIESILTLWGAEETHDGYTCPCGVQHTHETTLYISRLGRLFSYSPRCHLYTTKGYDAFGLYVKLHHNDNITDALKTLNPIQPRQKATGAAQSEPDSVSAEIVEARRKDALRKRDERQREAKEILADVRNRAANDTTLTPADHAILETLLTIAGERGWCRPSKARIVEMCGYSFGSVKRSLMNLEARGYFVSEGEGGSSNQTAIRTFLRGSSGEAQNEQMIHESYIASDLIIESIASERAPSSPPATSEQAPATTQPAERMSLVARLEAMSDEEFHAWYTRSATQPGQPKVAESGAIEPGDESMWATYTPIEPFDKPYSNTGIKRYLGISERNDYALALMHPIESALDAGDIAEPTTEAAQVAQKKRRRTVERPSAADRYLVELAGMSLTQLDGERKKHQNTLAKHKGARWLAGVRDKLALVEQMMGNELRARSQAQKLSIAASIPMQYTLFSPHHTGGSPYATASPG